MVLKLGTANEANPCRTSNVMAAAAPRSELPASNTSFSNPQTLPEHAYREMRIATTAARGTLGFFGTMRSFHAQTNPFCLPLLRTGKAK